MPDSVPMIRLSDVQQTAVHWLWYPYIPFGKLTILQGNPGEGKTYFAMYLTAACTNRQQLPNGELLEPFNVIYQTAEDGLGDTVKPRLIEAGADLDRVLVIDDRESMLTLTDKRIERAIRENQAKLLIIDPIQAFLGAQVDMNRANEVRPIFRALGEIAEVHDCAILMIGHLNKASGSQSTYRGLGSIDMTAAVRSLLFIGKVRDDPATRVLTHEKSSLAPPGKSLAFSLGDISIDDVQLFLNSKESLSKKTIDEIWLVVRMVLDVAFEDGLIPSNPSKSKRLRNPSKKKSTRLPLTTKEAEDIEAHLPDIPKLLDRRYVALLLYCPARSEDIRGIRMKDIDPHKMLIRIERSVTYAKAKTIIGDPKTEAGFRHMLMLPKLWDVLALTPEEMHDPDAYLLHMRDDTHQPLTFQANRRLWERVCAAINVYGKTPHCFRHTFATRAYRAGVSEKTLQSMGGWADLKTMQNVYIHTQEEDLENARRLLTLL